MSKEEKDKDPDIDESTPLERENNNKESTVASYQTTNYYPPPSYGVSYQPAYNYQQPPPGYHVNPGQPGYYSSSGPQPYYENPGQPMYYANPQVHRDDSRVDLGMQELARKRSKQLYCHNCRRYGWSRVALKNGIVNHLCCGYLCLIGCWLCCWIPYCCDECKDSEHFCDYCNTLLKIENPL